MKRLGLIVCTAIIFSAGACQEDQKDPTQEIIKRKKALYEASIKNNDKTTAALALNELILLDSNNIVYKDSLARIYIRNGNYVGGTQMGEAVIAAGSASNKLKELVGVAYQQMGDAVRARNLFQGMFNETNDYRYIYQVAAIVYETGDAKQFTELTDKILEDAKKDTAVSNTLIEFGAPISGQPQRVPIKAATLFLKGKFEQDINKKYVKAIVYYEQALGVYDKFEMPYYYIDEIDKARRQGLIK
ncbi:hypothetical protein GYB22_02810 [bacterium]|nr:hypothetical protein [bacterium]